MQFRIVGAALRLDVGAVVGFCLVWSMLLPPQARVRLMRVLAGYDSEIRARKP